MENNFEVRDHRRKEMFRVDDEYLNGYARLCGANATMVYLCLCRHSDRHQESFPSIELMAEKTGISSRSIIRGIQTLIKWNIISKERERRKDATWLNNRYTLLDKSVWVKKPSDTQSHGLSQVTNHVEPSDKYDTSQVTHSHTKDTHKKVAHIKDTHIGEQSSQVASVIIKAFEVVDAKNKTYYANKTQRKSADFLATTYGLENVLKVIELYKTLQDRNTKYLPDITSPYELVEKWEKLKNCVKREMEVVDNVVW